MPAAAMLTAVSMPTAEPPESCRHHQYLGERETLSCWHCDACIRVNPKDFREKR